MAFLYAEIGGDLDADLATYEQYIKDKVIFAGAAAMAGVIYDEVLVNLEKVNSKTGKLRHAIFRAYSFRSSSTTKKTYRIGWRFQDAPHGKLIEWGYWQRYRVVKLPDGDWITLKGKENKLASPKWIPAKPFLRPALGHMHQAIEAGKVRMAQRLSENSK
jgi:hypothetical protein